MKPEPIDYLSVMRELIEIWDESLVEDVVQLRAGGHHRSVPVIVRGLAAHAVDCGRAALLLYEANQTVAAAPVIRAILEDVITAEYVLAIPDGWKAIQTSSATQRRKALWVYLKREGSDPFLEQKLEDLKVVEKQDDVPLGVLIVDRAAAVHSDDPVSLYELYRYASDLTHAGMGVVHLYTSAQEGDSLGPRFRPVANHREAAAWFAVGAGTLLRALRAWDSILSDRPLAERLADIARRISSRERSAGE